MSSKLEFQKGVGEKIDAIGKDGADLQAITMFLFMHANTRERFESVVALEAATNRRAIMDCVPALKRAFWTGDRRE
ncbi:MAG: hypothetical protein NTU78_14655 [Alphaproteobacteria bacterium]|nr:hypothetical protein [Alphaproteobacteria bacterium]